MYRLTAVTIYLHCSVLRIKYYEKHNFISKFYENFPNEPLVIIDNCVLKIGYYNETFETLLDIK